MLNMNSISPDMTNLTLDTMNHYINSNVGDSTIALDLAINSYVTLDWADLSIVQDMTDCYVTPDGVNSTIGPDVIDCYIIPDGVDLTIALDAIDYYVTPDGVDLIIALDMIDYHVTPDGVDLTIALDAINGYVIPDGVDFAIALKVIDYCYVYPDGVNVTIQLDIMKCYRAIERVISQVNELVLTVRVNRCAVDVEQEDSQYCSDVNVNILMEKPIIHHINYGANAYSLYNKKDLPLFVKACVFVEKDQTTVYDIAEYPYFVFRSYQSDSLSFGETCKVCMCHLLESQLVHLIESIFHWSNHFCYFVLQNINMLVNLDLTPQQLCQRALLTTCQSLHYKHDFSIV